MANQTRFPISIKTCGSGYQAAPVLIKMNKYNKFPISHKAIAELLFGGWVPGVSLGSQPLIRLHMWLDISNSS